MSSLGASPPPSSQPDDGFKRTARKHTVRKPRSAGTTEAGQGQVSGGSFASLRPLDATSEAPTPSAPSQPAPAAAAATPATPQPVPASSPRRNRPPTRCRDPPPMPRTPPRAARRNTARRSKPPPPKAPQVLPEQVKPQYAGALNRQARRVLNPSQDTSQEYELRNLLAITDCLAVPHGAGRTQTTRQNLRSFPDKTIHAEPASTRAVPSSPHRPTPPP